MIIKKNTKLAALIILVLLFLFFIAFYIYSNYKYKAIYKKVDIAFIEELEKTNPKQLDFKLDSNVTYYNENENTYYYYIDEKYDKKYLTLDLEILSSQQYNYFIDDVHYNKKRKFYIDYLEPIKIILYNNKNYFEVNLKFTSVPILSIEANEIVHLDSEATLEFYGMDDGKLSRITSDTLIKLRGATSLLYPKKQYKLSLVKNEAKNEIAFLGMRKDEDWILDAMYADFSKIRSKLSFDIWNEMNSYTNNKIDNDIKHEYIDVYLNNEYIGLYLMKEFVDKKLLNLEETTIGNSGVLIKGTTWDKVNLAEYETNKKSNIVLPFEMKYPNNVYDYSIYWDSIIPKVYNYYFDSSKATDQYIQDTFDTYSFVDYTILANLIAALDNLGQKNIFLSVKNIDPETKVVITPWDLDMTFGYYFDSNSETKLNSNYDTYKSTYNILRNGSYINKLVIERYFELRGNILSVKHINSLIDSYYNQIKYSVIRDSEIWLETDLEKEIKNIKTWYEKRVKFLDEYLGEYDV